MTEKIKEKCKNCKYHFIEEISFDYPQSCCNKTNPCHTTEEWLKCDDFEYSKDFITNLQQENKRLTNLCVGHEKELRTKDIIIKQIRMEANDYKSRCEKTIEYINFVINHYKEQLETPIEDTYFDTDVNRKGYILSIIAYLQATLDTLIGSDENETK